MVNDLSDHDAEAFTPCSPEVRVAVAFRRWVAKLVDTVVFALAALILIGMLVAITPNGAMRIIEFGVGIVLLPVVADALCIATIRTTPGKWLAGISIESTQRMPLAFPFAFRRSVQSAVWGQGLQIPLVNVVGFARAYVAFRQNGYVAWDRGVVLRAPPLPTARRVALGAALTLYLLLVGAVSTSAWMHGALRPPQALQGVNKPSFGKDSGAALRRLHHNKHSVVAKSPFV